MRVVNIDKVEIFHRKHVQHGYLDFNTEYITQINTAAFLITLLNLFYLRWYGHKILQAQSIYLYQKGHHTLNHNHFHISDGFIMVRSLDQIPQILQVIISMVVIQNG